MPVELCPKCTEPGPFDWFKTTNDKWWLKRKLGESQYENDWHICHNKRRKYNCPQCGNNILQFRGEKELCSECLLKESKK